MLQLTQNGNMSKKGFEAFLEVKNLTNKIYAASISPIPDARIGDLAYTQCFASPAAIDNFARNVDAFWFIEPGCNTIGK